jgi:16S rRNA (cytosine967-C5)-methyltransferase
LVFGAFRHLRLLDYWIDKLAKKGIDSLPGEFIDILRLGFYQLAFLDRVPPHAAVNESLLLCEATGFTPMKGLANALLRGFQSKYRSLDLGLDTEPHAYTLLESHPEWLALWARNRLGEEKAALWMRHNNVPPRIHLFPLVSRQPPSGRDDLDFEDRERQAALHLLDGIGAGELDADKTSIRLPEGVAPLDLEVFATGLATIQDPAARKPVAMLDPRPGEVLYDCCAAPGGKTLQILDRTAGKGSLVALDSSAKRLRRVRENLERCGFGDIPTKAHDLLEGWPEDLPPGDAVLVDAPCSGLGTLRRKVDLRYRLTPDDIIDLAQKNLALLKSASQGVRPGGRLVYSTCTLTREENEDTVRRFLSESGGEWTLVEERTFPSWLEDREAPVAEAIPDCDASYSALLRKSRAD